MVERQPNTVYVASLSYGKDSIAMLEAIKQLGMPLDRIIHAEVWATDDISADLPPMVEFKKYADNIIKDRYGIEVEHTCAMRKVKPVAGGQENQKQTENVTHVSLHTKYNSIQNGLTKNDKEMSSMDSRASKGVGARNSNLEAVEWEKVTYEKLFYHIPKRKKQSTRGGGSSRIPASQGELVQRSQKTADSCSQQLQDSRQSRTGAMEVSKCQPCAKHPAKQGTIKGFPLGNQKVQWCNYLKRGTNSVFGQARERRAENKYRSIPRNRRRRARTNQASHKRRRSSPPCRNRMGRSILS